jgi:hypothetical protein
MMIDEKVKEAIDVLINYCKKHKNCKECIFLNFNCDLITEIADDIKNQGGIIK